MLKTFLSCLVLWLPLIWSSGVRPMMVVGCSMQPALQPGQLVLLHRDYYRAHPLEAGQVVAFRWEGRVYVKRVAALPGDSVPLLCRDGYCAVVEEALVPRVRRLAAEKPALRFRAVTVPEGYFFSLGDHATASIDSRELGPIPMTAVLGRVQALKEDRSG